MTVRAIMRAALYGVVLLGLVACSSGTEEVPLDRLPPEEIYARAEALMQAGKEEEAARLYGEVERLYPYSRYAEKALIRNAEALYKAKKYEEARAAAERFIAFYPASADAPWAQYLIALTWYDQIARVGRDRGAMLDALEALREVINRYPDSDYARSARLKLDFVLDNLAAKEMEVGRYYLKRGFYPAAINRFRVVVEDYPTSTQTPEALYRLVEAYLSLGLEDEARTAAAILAHNYRATDWYADAYRLLEKRGLEPAPKAGGWLRTVWRRVIRGEWL